MASTQLSDINYQSEVFMDYLEGEFTFRLGLLNSGLFRLAPDNIIAPTKGNTVSVAKVEALTGDSVQVNHSTSTTFNNVPDFKDTAVWVQREKAWSADQLLQVVAGRDATQSVALMLGGYWSREIHKSAVNVLTGVYGSALASTHSYDGSAGKIDAPGILNAKLLLGDNMDLLSIIVMNSSPYVDAVSGKLVVETPLGDNTFATGTLQRMLGLTPSVTDEISAVSSVYSSYIGQPGAGLYKTRPWTANAFTNANVINYPMGLQVELYRDSTNSGGTDGIISRLSYCVHVPGVAWNTGTPPANPTNAQLATSGYWGKVANDDKLIRIVELKTL